MAAVPEDVNLKKRVEDLDSALLEVGRVLYSSGRAAAADSVES